MTKYYIELVNGKRGYGYSSYAALVEAVGENKANIICENLADSGNHLHGRVYKLYAKNGNLVATVEKM